MELKHIDIAKLAVSAVNMRGKGKADLSNILPSVRARAGTRRVRLVARAGPGARAKHVPDGSSGVGDPPAEVVSR